MSKPKVRLNRPPLSPIMYLLIAVAGLLVTIAAFIIAVLYQDTLGGFAGLASYLILLVMGLATAAFLFGAMNAYAHYDGKQLEGNLVLGGPIVGAALVVVGGFFFLKNQPVSQPALSPTLQASTFTLEFTADFAPEDDPGVFRENLAFSQVSPPSVGVNIAPAQRHGTHGSYRIDGLLLPTPQQKHYLAKIRRQQQDSFQGNPNSLKIAEVCFEPDFASTRQNYVAEFDISLKESKVGLGQIGDNSWFTLCKPAGAGAISLPSLSMVLYAQGDPSGWIVPSLSTLQARKGSAYTGFTIAGDQMRGLEGATSYTYDLKVNGIPLYVDGFRKEDRRIPFDGKRPFKFEFGLENLDFSGADAGKETLQVTLDFYAGEKKLITIPLQRSYVALRDPDLVNLKVENLSFAWTGKHVGGKQDGYQVFIGSSTKVSEMTARKNKFDQVRANYQGQTAVSVIRPPLKNNASYGLLAGLVDKSGKVKFTFSKEDSTRILSWLKQDPRTRPIINQDSWVRPLRDDAP